MTSYNLCPACGGLTEVSDQHVWPEATPMVTPPLLWWATYYLAYYTHRAVTLIRDAWIPLLVGVVLVISLFVSANVRQRRAFENLPTTTTACYEDAWRICDQP